MKALAIGLLVFAIASPLAAQNTGFGGNKRGLSLGVGTYWHPLKNDNRYDPVPSLAPLGTNITDSNKIHLLPAKLGLYVARGRAQVEGYFRYMLNSRHRWTASGGLNGHGYVTFRSYGGGSNLGVSLLHSPRAKMDFVLNGEYVLQRASLNFLNAGTNETLNLKTTSMLAGVGLQPELWLGDLWVLSVFAGYQYGFIKNWEVAKASNFMGVARSTGPYSDAHGNPATAQFGGALVEISLKLNFYQ
jgi:hypothetical protein